MILSDSSIRKLLDQGKIRIDPVKDEQIQPCSIDLTLSHDLLVPLEASIEIKGVPPYNRYILGVYPLHPGDFVLGSTVEYINLDPECCLAGRVEGKSTLARLGLAVHVTAGFIDPGFCGNITLEMKNLGPYTILLRPGISICQLCFEQVDGHIDRPYGSDGLSSKYQKSVGTVGARR
jgi:dCTP deaminase